MAQATKGKLNFRCPSCFMRDIDIDMFFDEEKKEYYCLRCGFTGRYRYRAMRLRVADFGEDNEPPIFHPHKGGEQ